MDLGSSRTSGQIDTETGPKTSASRASHPDKHERVRFCKRHEEEAHYARGGFPCPEQRKIKSLPSLQLDDHQDGSDRTNYDNKGPQELDYPCPDV